MKRVVGIALGVVALVAFSCDRAVSETQSAIAPMETSSEVAVSASPKMQASSTKQTKTMRSGSFVSGEHPTSGMARLVTQNGKTVLQMDASFKTDQGPDLVVVLHRSSDVIGSTNPPAYSIQAGDYVFVAPLQKFSGAQSYTLPDTIDPADYQSVAIWCRQFNATFGAAHLQ